MPVYPPKTMRVSEDGKNFIKNYESGGKMKPQLQPYDDGSGFMTIGFGHKILPKEKFGTITEAQADKIFEMDLANKGVKPVQWAITTPLNQNQFDALVSLSFNLGGFTGGNKIPTLVNSGQDGSVVPPSPLVSKWREYRMSAGKVNAGLVNRREDEIEMYYYGDYVRDR